MARGASEEAGAFAARMSRLWRPQGLSSDWIVLALYRAFLVSLPIGAVSLPVAVAAFGIVLMGHRSFISGKVLAVLVVLALLPLIFLRGLRLRAVVRQGYWTRKGVPVRRAEQPRRFWFWTAVEALFAAVLVAAAGYLLLVGLALV